MVTHALAVVDINGTDSIAIANMKLLLGPATKLLKYIFSGYGTSNYRFSMNGVYHYNGLSSNLITPPLIKITAYS